MRSRITLHSDVLRGIKAKSDAAINLLAHRLFHEIAYAAPVDSFDLRRSITMSTNALPSSFNGQAVTVYAGDKVFIATDKVYAPIIEYGLYPNPPQKSTGKTANGYSTQAPRGFMRITTLNFAAQARGMKWT